jgi:peroxiredoxin
MVHVREIFVEYEKRDTAVLCVTAQDPEELRKFLKYHEFPYAIANDIDREVTKAYCIGKDIGPPRGFVPQPTHIVLDPEGSIHYTYIGERYNDFPEDSDIFGALDGV